MPKSKNHMKPNETHTNSYMSVVFSYAPHILFIYSNVILHMYLYCTVFPRIPYAFNKFWCIRSLSRPGPDPGPAQIWVLGPCLGLNDWVSKKITPFWGGVFFENVFSPKVAQNNSQKWGVGGLGLGIGVYICIYIYIYIYMYITYIYIHIYIYISYLIIYIYIYIYINIYFIKKIPHIYIPVMADFL